MPVSRRLYGARKSGASDCPLFNNSLRICAEVDEQAKLGAGQPKVIHQLRPVFFGQRLHSLDFDNDLSIAVKVWDIRFLDRCTFVEDAKLLLCIEWYATGRELAFKTLLVYLFPEAVSEFAVDLIYCAANGIALVWIYHLPIHGENYSKIIYGFFSCNFVNREGGFRDLAGGEST